MVGKNIRSNKKLKHTTDLKCRVPNEGMKPQARNRLNWRFNVIPEILVVKQNLKVFIALGECDML